MFELDKARYRLSNQIQKVSRKPYPFQEDAMKALERIKVMNPNGFATMLVLPTGAGKTYTAVHWIINRYINQGIKVLWIAHRSELLRQAAETFYSDTTAETLPDRSDYISCVVSSEFGYSERIKGADVVIASRQSVISGDNINYYKAWARGKDKVADRKVLLVLDEAHHASCQSYRKIIKELKRIVPNLDVLGLTATPERTAKNEQGSLKKIFNTGSGVAYSVDLSTLIKLGILADMHQEEIKTPVDMAKSLSEEELKKIVKYDLTSLDQKTLEKITKNKDRNKLIVDTYANNQVHYGKTLVFAIDVVNAIALNGLFQERGIRSDYVVSGLVTGPNNAHSANRNSDVIAAFRNNELDVLINVNIITEGTDIPDIQSVFLARPTTSRILMTQMVGRGLRRTKSGKTSVNIVSFIDEWRGLVSFVSPRFLLEGEDTLQENKKTLKDRVLTYINSSDIEKAAVDADKCTTKIASNVKNIYPYGIIECSYMTTDENGDESEYSADIMVFDEVKDIIEGVLQDIKNAFDPEKGTYSEDEIREKASEIYFKYAEQMKGTYVGLSTEVVSDLIKDYLASGVIPAINKLTDRVDLFEIAAGLVDFESEELEQMIQNIWESRKDIQKWYDFDYYKGLMKVYRQRHIASTLKDPKFILPDKEDMDMATLSKYYPEYYKELKEYVFQKAWDPEIGGYKAKRIGRSDDYFSSPHRKFFEIDHIVPISKGGKTQKDNLQLLYYKDNKIKGNKILGQ